MAAARRWSGSVAGRRGTGASEGFPKNKKKGASEVVYPQEVVLRSGTGQLTRDAPFVNEALPSPLQDVAVLLQGLLDSQKLDLIN